MKWLQGNSLTLHGLVSLHNALKVTLHKFRKIFSKEKLLNLNNISFYVAFYCYPTVRTTRIFLNQPDVYIVDNFFISDSFYCSKLFLGMVKHENEFETMEK